MSIYSTNLLESPRQLLTSARLDSKKCCVKRRVRPEILDFLPEDDPEALRNRIDIRRLNMLMGNYRWFARELGRHLSHRDTVLEVGAGTGELALFLDDKVCRRKGVRMGGLDLCSRPSSWNNCWLWHRIDLTLFQDFCHYSVIIASMIFHQFEIPELRRLGEKLNSHSRLILASETARRRIHIHQLILARLIGINRVTMHDAKISIEAGFVGEELPHFLGLDSERWSWTCRCGLLGQYRMIAVRDF